MFSEDQLLPISALQHLLFCERQAALIHVERLWVENRLTVEGRHLHDKTHGEKAGPRGGGLVESRPGIRVSRAVPLRSMKLGLFGVADVVEFHAATAGTLNSIATDSASTDLAAARPFPVEYKRGRPKRNDCDRVQLCAQAVCLEEMLGVAIPRGALFYARTRRREDVAFDTALRRRLEDAAARLHQLIASRITPTAKREPKCKLCSLLPLCMPEVTGVRRSVARYVQNALAELGADKGESETPNRAKGGGP